MSEPNQASLVSDPKITVIGSINMDLVIRCQTLPLPGETISAQSMTEVSGGKGANQAVAAARCGGRVQMVGCVGDDGFGVTLLKNLKSESVDCEFIRVIENCESGTAVVAVEQSGENSIIVVPGANGQLSADHVRACQEMIAHSDAILVQLETPMDAVAEAIRLAKENSVRVILDPAPASKSMPDELFEVDLICPNESEAQTITGRRLESLEDVSQIAIELKSRGAKAVAITMGEQGTFLDDGQKQELIPSIQINAVDTTAAGDAFAAALAVRWSQTGQLRSATQFANVAGAIAASSLGAQTSLPHKEQIKKLTVQLQQ